MSSAAEMLKRALAGSQGHVQQPITDDLALGIAKRLEARGIARVPGLPEEEETSEDRIKRVLKYLRDEKSAEAAEPQPEAAPPPQQSTAGIVREAISSSIGSSGHIPLNGAAVLRAALAGGPGTINGGPAE
jgi:hypothetical protein